MAGIWGLFGFLHGASPIPSAEFVLNPNSEVGFTRCRSAPVPCAAT